MSEADGDLRRAWGWVDHLRGGGTTPWHQWQRPATSYGPLLPGAQQLELLRLTNLAGTTSPMLAEAILAASAPGRGRPDLELAGAVPVRTFGPAPVDPAHLPRAELLRVATSVIADRVVAAGAPEPVRAGVPRPWRRRYRLVGDPVLAAPVRAELIGRGRPPGGRRPLVLVLGTDVETMIAHAYRSRLADAGAPPWAAWLRVLRQRDHLPPRVDLLDITRRWTERVGEARVRVVTDPAALPRLLGVRRRLPAPSAISPDGLELARQVAAVLGVLVRPEHRQRLVDRRLLPSLADLAPGPGPGVPARHHDWLAGRTERLRQGLAATGVEIVGDLADLGPTERGHRPRGSEAGVLELAIALLHLGDDERRGETEDTQ